MRLIVQLSLVFVLVSAADLNWIEGHLQLIRADSFSNGSSDTYALLYNHDGNVYHLEFKDEEVHNHTFHLYHSHLQNQRERATSHRFGARVNGRIIEGKTHSQIWGENHLIFEAHGLEKRFLDAEDFQPTEEKRGIIHIDETAPDLRRMVLIIVNMKDESVSCASSEIDGEMWRNKFSVKGLYETNSYGKVEFVGDIRGQDSWDIFGPYEIDFNNGDRKTCAPDEWAQKADVEATKAGVYLPNYQHRVYAIPRATDKYCKWEGLGWVGCGLYCRAWVNTCDRMEVFVHELGHNLGMSHAASNYGESGNVITYGDPTAFMGNSFFSSDDQLTFNAPHKDQVKWFTSEKELNNVTHTGMYALSPLNELTFNSEHPNTIKITHPDTREPYYFSYLTVRTQYAQRLLVHNWPNTSAPTGFIGALEGNGDYFTDKYDRFSVTQWSVSSEKMELWIAFGCEMQQTLVDFFSFHPNLRSSFSVYNSEPEYSWTNQTDIDIYDGVSATVTIRISNTDSPLCTPVNYKIQPRLPDGWTADLSETLYLTPGQTCFLEFTITPSSGAIRDEYDIRVDITGITEDFIETDLHKATLLATANLERSCVQLAPEITLVSNADQLFTSNGQMGTYILRVRNSDGIFCESSEFNIDVQSPKNAEWVVKTDTTEIKLSPGQVSYVTLSVTPPKSLVLGNGTFVFVVNFNDSSRVGHNSSFRLNLAGQNSECSNSPFLRIDETYFLMQTRQSGSTVLHVTNTNPPHCPPAYYLLGASNTKTSTIPQHLFIPPGITEFSVVMFTASLNPSEFDVNATIDITAQDAFYPESSATGHIQVEVLKTACIRRKVYFTPRDRKPDITCAALIDNTTSVARCWVYVYNNDDWPCPDSVWQFNITVEPHNEWTWNIPNTFVLFPKNTTEWQTFNVTLRPDQKNVTVSISITDITPNQDNATKALHYASYTRTYPVDTCVRKNPTLVLDTTNITMFRGQTVSFNATLTNNDNKYCQWTQLYYAGPAERTSFRPLLSGPGFSAIFTPGGADLAYNGYATIEVNLTADPTRFLPPFNKTFNVSIEFYDADNVTHSAKQFFNVSVDNSCVQVAPSITIDPPFRIVPVGQSRYVEYHVNITNNDTTNCTNTTYQLFAGGPNPSSGWSLSLTPDVIEVAPQKSAFATFGVTNRENIGSGNYTLVVGAYDVSKQSIHYQVAVTILGLNCTQPRPPVNIKATPIRPYFSFGLQAGPVFLQWEACSSGLWCCCPCKYRVQRDGEVIGISDSLNFTDTANLHVDINYVYTITTIDVHGAESSAVMCDNVIAVDIAPPSIRPLVAYMGICVASLIGLAIFIVMLNHVLNVRNARKVGEDASYIPSRIRRFFKVVFHRCLRKRKVRPLLELKDMEEKEGLVGGGSGSDYDN